jgi:hypothetical protein
MEKMDNTPKDRTRKSKRLAHLTGNFQGLVAPGGTLAQRESHVVNEIAYATLVDTPEQYLDWAGRWRAAQGREADMFVLGPGLPKLLAKPAGRA